MVSRPARRSSSPSSTRSEPGSRLGAYAIDRMIGLAPIARQAAWAVRAAPTRRGLDRHQPHVRRDQTVTVTCAASFGLIDEVRVYNRALSTTEIQTDKDTAISTIGGGPSDNPYQFTGRENDGTGLYYYRARYYSPGMKRFISEDPIGFAGGDTNLQSYVQNSPPNYIDPSGKRWGVPDFPDVGDIIGDATDAISDAATGWYVGDGVSPGIYCSGRGGYEDSAACRSIAGCVFGGGTAVEISILTGVPFIPGIGQTTLGGAALAGCVSGGAFQAGGQPVVPRRR